MGTPDADADRAVAELVKDYKTAARTHVPGYTGGINRKVAAELVRMGWRKAQGSN